MEFITYSVRHRKSQKESITDRQERIAGWHQDRLEQGRVLLLGAGALGNEVAKNLALMGLGYMLVVDMERVELSNLSRAVFFRKDDVQQHEYKAEIVARRAHQINIFPNAAVQALHRDIVWQLGGGVFRRVDVVLGCLDNVEARIIANANCLLTGTPFLDGGILGLSGNVTAVHPPLTACWECTTNRLERAQASSRYDSCSRVMYRDVETGRLPAVQVASSIIAGFQAQEAVKVIQGMPWAAGQMILYDASTSRPDLDVITISRRPDCWCNKGKMIENVLELPLSATINTLNDLIDSLIQHGYSDPNIKLPGRFIISRYCSRCRRQDSIMRPHFRVDTTILICPFCKAEGNEWIQLQSIEETHPRAFAQLEHGNDLRQQTLYLPLIEVGFPSLALVQFAASDNTDLTQQIAELSGDAPTVMGGELYATIRRKGAPG